MSNHILYAAGDRQCEICGKDLPAMHCWVGRTRFVCDTPECRSEVHKRSVNKLVIGPNEKICANPGCCVFAPAGNYDPRTKYFFCSDVCKAKFWQLGTQWINCAWPPCGKRVRKPQRANVADYFCCAAHNNLFHGDVIVRERAGQYFPLLEEYLVFCKTHYRKVSWPRNAMAYFFQFLNLEGISDIDQVNSKVITRFLAWEIGRGVKASHYMSFVKTFFDWLIAEDRRTRANPVVRVIHKVRHPKRLARPYSEEELAYIWKLLLERGSIRLLLAFVIGLETGLRISEVCDLRLQDVDLLKQKVFVDIPNKTMSEGTSYFHELTRKYLPIWLEERNSNCGHNFLLHNTRDRRCTANALTLEFNRVLCKLVRDGKGKKVQRNEEGLDSFAFHRLRHSMASRMGEGGADLAAIMAQGRWGTTAAALGYIAISEEKKRRSFNETMERSRERRRAPRTRTSSFQKSTQHQPSAS